MTIIQPHVLQAIKNTARGNKKPGGQAGREYLEAFARLHSIPSPDQTPAPERHKGG